jgi:hypothetical protein
MSGEGSSWEQMAAFFLYHHMTEWREEGGKRAWGRGTEITYLFLLDH